MDEEEKHMIWIMYKSTKNPGKVQAVSAGEKGK